MHAPTFTEEVSPENVGAIIDRPAGNVAFIWRFFGEFVAFIRTAGDGCPYDET